MLRRGARRSDPLTIPFRPNRLVVFEASDTAWHSVTRIDGPADRVNVTAYYYEPDAVRVQPRLTRFAGWPWERGVSAVLAAHFGLRPLGARLGLRRLVRNPHSRISLR